jgi:hypothetical protein
MPEELTAGKISSFPTHGTITLSERREHGEEKVFAPGRELSITSVLTCFRSLDRFFIVARRSFSSPLRARRFVVLVLTVANWPALRPHEAAIAATGLNMKPGRYREWLA